MIGNITAIPYEPAAGFGVFAQPRYVEKLPVKILPCPIEFPRLMYYQLWHERTHASAPARWLRERVKSVAAELRKE